MGAEDIWSGGEGEGGDGGGSGGNGGVGGVGRGGVVGAERHGGFEGVFWEDARGMCWVRGVQGLPDHFLGGGGVRWRASLGRVEVGGSMKEDFVDVYFL